MNNRLYSNMNNNNNNNNNEKNVFKDINSINLNMKPVKLLNNETNICWWNTFAQLFGTTRDISIVDSMMNFINKHDCHDNSKCWYCNILKDFITIMANSNELITVDLAKNLFNIPGE